jgi:hypothetical protein
MKVPTALSILHICIFDIQSSSNSIKKHTYWVRPLLQAFLKKSSLLLFLTIIMISRNEKFEINPYISKDEVLDHPWHCLDKNYV